MSPTSRTKIMLKGFEKTWSKSYELAVYRLHLSMLYTPNSLHLSGLITLTNGLFPTEKLIFCAHLANLEMIEEEISDLGRFSLMIAHETNYDFYLKQENDLVLVDKVIIH